MGLPEHGEHYVPGLDMAVTLRSSPPPHPRQAEVTAHGHSCSHQLALPCDQGLGFVGGQRISEPLLAVEGPSGLLKCWLS